ncbi:hypothetical protein WMY93_028379 [Mugilogobius chulae]|uniref:G-protein coupled receptors family 1 profile domain-containing protein n=1 Tax=Mugilogobius chulae TaxID=88201 RepID=A0AAW0MRQ7_9GOBI
MTTSTLSVVLFRHESCAGVIINVSDSEQKLVCDGKSSAMPNSSDSVVLLLEGLVEGTSLPIFLFLLLVYLFVVFSNVSIFGLIFFKRSLHQPMYLLYLNLSANDLLGNTNVIPRLLVDLLRPASLRHIHLYSCVVQAFLSHLFGTTGHTILMIMAFDRYMAICSPLHYSAIMSGRTVVKLTVWAWTVAFFLVSILIGLSLRLTRCRSFIFGLYCSNASLFKLSCENTYINNIYGLFFTAILLSSSIGSIVVTYTKITVVCWTSKSASLNRKALQTCSTHLFSYLLFLCSGMLIIIFHRFPHLVQERKFITIMYHLLPSSLNPLIYGVQSKEIRRSFSALNMIHCKVQLRESLLTVACLLRSTSNRRATNHTDSVGDSSEVTNTLHKHIVYINDAPA